MSTITIVLETLSSAPNLKATKNELKEVLKILKQIDKNKDALVSTKSIQNSAKLTEQLEKLRLQNEKLRQSQLNRAQKVKQAQQEESGILGRLLKQQKALRTSIKTETNVTQLGKLNVALKKTSKNITNFKNVGLQSTNTFGKALDSFAFKFNVLGNIVGNAVSRIGRSVIQGFGNALKTIKDFEKGVDELSAITGATGADLDFLKESAIELGFETTRSAVDIVEAFKLVASAKPELLANGAALKSVTKDVLTLSEASGLDLVTSTKSLTGVLNQFNLGAEESTRVINALAAGSKFGAAEVPKVAEAIIKFGVAAKSANVSVEESVGLVELLAEKGVEGAEAGTQLRNVLIRLNAPEALPTKARKALEKFGVNLDLVSDKSLPLNERLREFGKISGDAAALVNVFGKENSIVGEIVLQNVDRFQDLTDKVTGTNTAFEQAAINTNNLAGDTAKFSAALGSMILSFDDGEGAINSFLRGTVQLATGIVKLIGGAEDLTQEWRDAKAEADALENSLTPLLDRYDELASQTTLTKDEQIELDDIINQVAADLPGAITQIDKYGKAMAISTDAARGLVSAQQRLVAKKNEDAIEDITERFTEQRNILKALERNYRTSAEGIIEYRDQLGEGKDAIFLWNQASGEQLIALSDGRAAVQAEREDLALLKDELEGGTVAKDLDTKASERASAASLAAAEAAGILAEAEAKAEKAAKAREKAAKKRRAEFLKAQDELLKALEGEEKVRLALIRDEEEKELALNAQKFDALFLQANNNAELEQDLIRKQEEEIIEIRKKFAEDGIKAASEAEKKRIAELLRIQANQDIVRFALLEEGEEKEIAANAAKFDALFLQAEDNAELELQLLEKQGQEEDAIRKKFRDKEKEDRAKARQEAVDTTVETTQLIIDGLKDRSKEVETALGKEITQQDANIKRQQDLADKGLENTLAFEERKKAELLAAQAEEQKRQEKIAKAETFFKLLSAFASEDPKSAVTKALQQIVAAEIVAATFEDGGAVDDVIDSKKGKGGYVRNGIFHGRSHSRGGILIEAQGKEGIFSVNEMKNLGKDNFYAIKQAAKNPIDHDIFEQQAEALVLSTPSVSHQNHKLEQKMDEIKQAIIDKPVQLTNWDMYGNRYETMIKKGVKKTKINVVNFKRRF